MDFDYESLRKYTTDEIYNTYISQLTALKLKNQKNIMGDFEFIEAKIIDIRDENGILNVDIYLNVKDFDYVVDKYNDVIRGKSNQKLNIEYIITLVKKSGSENQTITCPNCGAKIEAVAGGKCEYCNTVIEVPAADYVMSKKTCINQRME
jgi:tRNA(Ile2) C34 agmatinyltransferase TiaS